MLAERKNVYGKLKDSKEDYQENKKTQITELSNELKLQQFTNVSIPQLLVLPVTNNNNNNNNNEVDNMIELYKKKFNNEELKEASIPKKFDYTYTIKKSDMDAFYDMIRNSINKLEGASNIFSIDDVKGNIHVGESETSISKIPFAGSFNLYQKSTLKKNDNVYEIIYHEYIPNGFLNSHKAPVRWLNILNKTTKKSIITKIM